MVFVNLVVGFGHGRGVTRSNKDNTRVLVGFTQRAKVITINKGSRQVHTIWVLGVNNSVREVVVLYGVTTLGGRVRMDTVVTMGVLRVTHNAITLRFRPLNKFVHDPFFGFICVLQVVNGDAGETRGDQGGTGGMCRNGFPFRFPRLHGPG